MIEKNATGCRHILTVLAVSDVARAVTFYRTAFDFIQTVDVPVYAEFETGDGQRIGLYQRQSFGVNTGIVPRAASDGELSGAELYFHSDNPEEQCRKLLAAGGRELSPWKLRDWGDYAAYFRDSDGHVIVIARPDT